jgi:cysteine synthase A
VYHFLFIGFFILWAQKISAAVFRETPPVTNEDACDTARRMAMKEGIFGGITSDANVWAAIQRARKPGPGKKIVTIVIDSGLKP